MEERVVLLRRREGEKVLRYQEKFSNENICGWWYPGCGADRSLKPDWDNGFESMTSVMAPVFCCFNEKGESCILIACLEIKERVRMRCGIEEETGRIHCRIEIPMDFLGEEGYETRLYISTRREPYETAIARAAAWWETEGNLQPMEVPEEARLPMYSTWYSYHQEMTAAELEQECRIAKELGMDTIIVDDGWQTKDVSRGYAYCGDWRVCLEKFPDFQGHVQRVHAKNMKYMMWISVPFVGKDSHIWERFRDKLLTYIEHQKAGVLDPRYSQVRRFIRDSCMKLVQEYDIDGLKLDFIDEFYIREAEKGQVLQPGMDFYSVQEAVDCMMKEIAGSLRRLKPGFLIEFRQKYIGPNMRQYGNIFRVDDCPGAWISNRIGVVDLRLLSRTTAVHSDMIMWQEQAAPSEIAVHLINSIWGTFQISVKLETLTSEVKGMIRFWLDFARVHRKVLQEGELKAKDPLQLYPMVESQQDGVWIAAIYEDQTGIEMPAGIREGWMLYAGKQGKVYLEAPLNGSLELLDCTGKRKEIRQLQPGLVSLFLDTGSLVHFLPAE